MIGVPTSLPVSVSASSDSARIPGSNEASSSASASSTGSPTSARIGSTKDRLPRWSRVGMSSRVFGSGRELGVVVDIGIDHPQRDEPPVHRIVPLRHDRADPFAGHPREWAHRVEVEVDIGVAHGLKASPLRYLAKARGAERGATDSTLSL